MSINIEKEIMLKTRQILVTFLCVLVFTTFAQEDTTKRFSYLVEYSYGFNRDYNTLLTIESRPISGGKTVSQTALYGQQLLTIGSRYRLTKSNFFLQACLSKGFGQNNFDLGVTVTSSEFEGTKYEQFLSMYQKETSVELGFIKQFFSTRNFGFEIGAGGYYRDYNIEYNTGLNTKIITNRTGVILDEGMQATYYGKTLGYFGSAGIMVKVPKYRTDFLIRCVGLEGEKYTRYSGRAAVIFHL